MNEKIVKEEENEIVLCNDNEPMRSFIDELASVREERILMGHKIEPVCDNGSTKDTTLKSYSEIKKVKSSSLKTLIDTFRALGPIFGVGCKIIIQGLLINSLIISILVAVVLLVEFLYQMDPIGKILWSF